jgi:hypothetical protein
LEKPSAEVRFVLLQRQLAEVRFQMLFPDLLIATNSRRLFAWFAGQLDDLFAVREVVFLPELRDRHVLLGHRRSVHLAHEVIAQQLHWLRLRRDGRHHRRSEIWLLMPGRTLLMTFDQCAVNVPQGLQNRGVFRGF